MRLRSITPGMIAALSLLATAACAPPASPPVASSHYVFAWAGDSAKRSSDFLAVIDVDPKSPTYATVVATAPVGATGTSPHHTEHVMPAGGVFFANGFAKGETYLFDLHDPRAPRVAGSFGDVGPFTHPHTFVRLPNQHVLATFQMQMDGAREETGGLAELTPEGKPIRWASGADPSVDSTVRPYSVAILPTIDRLVTTATDMHGKLASRAVQVWRLSDLHLLHTILLPPGPNGDENYYTAEPRVLDDGRTVLLNTFNCGLYRLSDIDTDHPTATWMYSAHWKPGQACAIPVLTGHYWLQTVGTEHAVVSLDISDPLHPREVSRLTFGPNDVPHWLSLEPNGQRIVITGYAGLLTRLLLAHFNPATGALALDSSFKEPGAKDVGFSFARPTWPHGATGTAIPHGTVFSLPGQ
jgi:hypothetical protein